MNTLQAAIYARVSSEQQATAHTIASQVAALQAQVAADGLALPTTHAFLDEGYSGATLVRPALERLRDLAAAGGVDRLYVHSPDRLARKYAYQVLLVDEFQRLGVALIFLNRPLGQTPEDDLLLQVQGMVAEYERAKMLERSRRGKRHAAQAGAVAVLGGAPFGYRYIGKQEGAGQARYEIVLEEARVVRQVFAWVGRDRLSINEVCRRLQAAGERTRSGKTTWDRTTVWGILKNPAYHGQAAFGKTRSGPLAPRLREQRHRPAQPRHAHSVSDVPVADWISIPVPALVSADLFATVQEQLTENRRRARQGQRGARYLLQGLVCCARCQYAYYGKAISPSARKGHPRAYAYYRCIGTDAYRFGGQRICDNHQVRTDQLDAAVWQQVRGLLEQPERLAVEYQRRLTQPSTDPHAADRASVEGQVRKLRQGIGRLIDAYAEGMIEQEEFAPRISRLKERVAKLEAQARQLADQAALQQELTLLIGRLDAFAGTVRERLNTMEWAMQRTLIRTLVKRVEIDHEEVNVVFRINPEGLPTPPNGDVLPDCGRRDHPTLWCTFIGREEYTVVHVACLQPLFTEFLSWYLANGVEQVFVVDVVERAHTLLPPSTNPHEESGAEPPQEVIEVEVTDPTHPLFGRRFPLRSCTALPTGAAHVLVAYRDYMSLRIPLAATNLGTPRPSTPTKLTGDAVTDLVALAEQWERLCPRHPPQSGAASRQSDDAASSTNSPPFSVR